MIRPCVDLRQCLFTEAHLDEEGGTTDTVSTENSNKLDKDSGVGRTDESTRNDESSGQENFDLDSLPPNVNMKYRRSCNLAREHHHSSDSFTSMDTKDHDIPSEDCDKFREALEHKCDSIENSPRKMNCRKNSQGSIDNELVLLNKEMEDIQIECQELVDAHKSKVQQNQKTESLRSPRIVPRMGTRLDYLKHVQLQEASEFILARKDSQVSKSNQASDKDKDTSTTSAYNTGESCRSTPLTLELNLASDDSERGFKNSMLCLAPPAVTVPSSSDTEKQTQTPTRVTEFSSDDSRGKRNSSKENRKNQANNKNLKEQAQMDESIQDLYIRCADVMYTNHANLQHTMAVQQKLFQQQLEQRARPYGHIKSQSSSSPTSQSNVEKSRVESPKGSSNRIESPKGSSNKNKVESPQGTSNPPSESGGQMEWVVKRRPDGTRYIARRPIRSKLLKERARKVAEERCGMTTDDDAMSELKVGRYWTKEERKRHLEKVKDHKRKKEIILKSKMDTVKEEDKKEINIVDLSHRKMLKHKGKKVFDDFVTIQEMLAHGSRIGDGKSYMPLLSVTTV